MLKVISARTMGMQDHWMILLSTTLQRNLDPDGGLLLKALIMTVMKLLILSMISEGTAPMMTMTLQKKMKMIKVAIWTDAVLSSS